MVQTLFMLTASAQNVARQFEKARIVRQSSACDFELSKCPLVIQVATIEILGADEMSFPGVGTKSEHSLNRFFRLR